MRIELLWNLRLLCERLAEISLENRRYKKLAKTAASKLIGSQIDSLELLELVKQDIPDFSPQCIYDIGANVGVFTLLVKAIFPDVEIHAFEPHPDLREKFLENTQHLTNIHFHPIAAGSEKCFMKLNETNFIDASSLLNVSETGTKIYDVKKVNEIVVQVENLDDYVLSNNLNLPDLIKLDIQGYELEALQGLTYCLDRSTYILSEVSFKEIYQQQCIYHEIVNFLAKHSFLTYAFGKGINYGIPLNQADILFKKIK